MKKVLGTLNRICILLAFLCVFGHWGQWRAQVYFFFQPDGLPWLWFCWELNLLSRSPGKVREQQELSEHWKEAKLGVKPDPPLLQFEIRQYSLPWLKQRLPPHAGISLTLPCELFPSRSELLTRLWCAVYSQSPSFHPVHWILLQSKKEAVKSNIVWNVNA